jgi:hypothetical protein
MKGTFVTQHDHHANNDGPNNTSTDTAATSRSEDVTRDQGGQFYMESDSIAGPPEDAIEAEQDARIENSGVDTINALQVTMDRSGAEYIHAQKAFLTNSGAKIIEGESSKLTQSGVLQLRTGKATLHQSSAILVNADEVQVESGSVMVSQSAKATFGEGVNVAVMQAGTVEADGDIRAFMLLGGNVKAGGNIESTMDTTSAAVFGAVFGAVFALIWRMIRRD